MNINRFVDQVAEQFDDVSSPLTPETKFREVEGWCSIIALSIIAMVDEEYEVTLKGDDIRNSVTIQDIFNIVVARRG